MYQKTYRKQPKILALFFQRVSYKCSINGFVSIAFPHGEGLASLHFPLLNHIEILTDKDNNCECMIETVQKGFIKKSNFTYFAVVIKYGRRERNG